MAIKKVIYECPADAFKAMTLDDMIAWLQGIAAEQPCPPTEIVFDINQMGDQWDGYSCAEISIERPETEEESAARYREEVEREAQFEAEHEALQRAHYERLKAKFG